MSYLPRKPIFCLILVIFTGSILCSCSRHTHITKQPSGQASNDSTDQKKDDKLKPYKSIITDNAETQIGFFSVHKVENKYYFELPDSILNTDILLVNRIARGNWEMRKAMEGYAGDPIGQFVIRFEKGPDRRIFIREFSHRVYNADDSTSSMYNAIHRNNVPEIVAAFKIKAFTPDSTGNVIDVTEYIEGDNALFAFKYSSAKKKLGLKEFQGDRSYINYVRSFPNNVEVNTTKTYKNGDGAITLELNTSLVALPKNPMQPRFYDPRVGFISLSKTDFESNPHGVRDKELITRWRLEPKPEDRTAYFRGELVEPQKQIVYYIDPATPEKWIPYLIQGVNDWQEAFEKAGFKNAIIGKRAPTPEEDPTWSLLDARHSAIIYKPSQTMNASGPHIHDPRTGEILESHINWYHNVMELLHMWYLVQAGAVDPEARSMEFSDELMGELIRFVAAHEVGHTIGLAHNWAASYSVPVENLRNKEWLRKHGHTPSIMDYARFNYVAQPEDSVDRYGLFPHIGEYDRWAIEWGYRLLPGMESAEQEHPHLRKLTTERLNKDERLLYVEQIYGSMDPRAQNEDLGDDVIKASEYGIMNLKRVIPNLPEWTRRENEDYSDLKRLYDWSIRQVGLYYTHVTNNITAIYYTAKTVEQPGKVYERVPKSVQKEALAFLDKHLFTTPEWLIEPTVINQTTTNPLAIIGNLQEKAIKSIVGGGLGTLLKSELLEEDDAYSPVELMSDLSAIILREVKARKPIDIYRQNLQRKYIERLAHLITPRKDNGPISLEDLGDVFFRESHAIIVVKGELRRIEKLVNAAIPSARDEMTLYHLQDLSDRINQALNPGS